MFNDDEDVTVYSLGAKRPQKAGTAKRIRARKANTSAGEILFAEAKARLDQVFDLLNEYNEIAEALTGMGYETSVAIGDRFVIDSVPVPSLCLSSGNQDFFDSDFLDEYFNLGPVANKSAVRITAHTSLSKQRSRIGAACDWTCFYCGEQGDNQNGPDNRGSHVDHVYPISRGGDNRSDNLVLACATCNLGKRARSAAEYFRNALRRETALVTDPVSEDTDSESPQQEEKAV